MPPPKAGLKIRQGHIDEVPGAGCWRPAGGWYWELRWKGDPQGHAGVDPPAAETQVRGLEAYGLGWNLCVVESCVQRSLP